MKLSEIDRLCDLFEDRLKSREGLTVHEFLVDESLPEIPELVVELNKLHLEIAVKRETPNHVPVQVSPADVSTTVIPSVSDVKYGSIGHYQLLQKLGEGGMGVVYLARQEHPVRRQVALKLIKPGMDSQQVLARFEAERQALALMDHPNIARVFDAGTASDGRPYFVMELVHGVAITQYCHAKRLTPPQRLELFISVCHAVQHAHHKGVIHRDLKPSNVLVKEAEGRPGVRIIDFGLAKAIGPGLTEESAYTQFGQIVGTIGYMSPEQASFNTADIDTRTDVYALGVLLYELLTGETPFDRSQLKLAAIDEMLRTIREDDPKRPSSRLSSHNSLPLIATNRSMDARKLQRLLRGELDWIVMRALEKNRARRYDTPNTLAQDLERYLKQQPIAAGPPGVLYQVRKFAVRHRGPVLAFAMLLFSLVVGVIGTSLGLIRAVSAERSALIEEILSSWDYGRQLCESGEIAHGVLIIAQALESVPSTETDLKQSLLLELTAWHRQCDTLQGVYKHPDKVLALAMNPGQHVFATGCADGVIRRFSIDKNEVAELGSTGAEVRAVAITTDASIVVSGDADGQLLIWSDASDSPSHRLEKIEGAIAAVAISPDQRLLLCGGSDQHVRLWDLKNRTLLHSIPVEFPILTASFSSDSRVFVVGGGKGKSGELRIYPIDFVVSQEPVMRISTSLPVLSGSISPDGTMLVVGDANWETSFWDVRAGKKLATADFTNGSVTGAAFSPDGRLVLTSAADSHVALIWKVAELQEVIDEQQESGLVLREHGASDPLCPPLLHPAPLTSIAFVDADGQRYLTACEDGFVRLWKRAEGPETLTIVHPDQMTEKRSRYVRSVAIDPSGEFAAAAGEDGQVRCWNTATGHPAGPSIDFTVPVLAVDFTANDSIVAGCDDDSIRRWNVRTGRELATPGFFSHGLSSLSLSADRKTVLVGGAGIAQRWQIEPFKPRSAIMRHTNDETCSLATAVSPNKDRLVTCGENWMAKLWDGNGQLVAEMMHQSAVRCAAFSPNGRWVATGGDDRTVKVWDSETGVLVSTLLHDGDVFAVTFVSNELLLSGSRAGCQIWNHALARRIGPPCISGDTTMCVDFCSQQNVAVTGDWSGTCVIWKLPQALQLPPDELFDWMQCEVGMKLDSAGGREVLNGQELLRISGHLTGR